MIELMIVVVIIGILASIGIPQYRQYALKAKFTEVKMAASAIRKAVESCYAINGGPGPSNQCNEAAVTNPIRNQVTTNVLQRAAKATSVRSVNLTPGTFPIITVIPEPTPESGLQTSDEYLLIGTVSANGGAISHWREDGGGCSAGYC